MSGLSEQLPRREVMDRPVGTPAEVGPVVAVALTQRATAAEVAQGFLGGTERQGAGLARRAELGLAGGAGAWESV